MTCAIFFTPSPLVTVTNQLILFLLSAFWGPPSPPTSDVIYGSPQHYGGLSSTPLIDSFGRQIPEERVVQKWRSDLRCADIPIERKKPLFRSSESSPLVFLWPRLRRILKFSFGTPTTCDVDAEEKRFEYYLKSELGNLPTFQTCYKGYACMKPSRRWPSPRGGGPLFDLSFLCTESTSNYMDLS